MSKTNETNRIAKNLKETSAVVAMLAAIAAAFLLFAYIIRPAASEREGFLITASFYPMYVAALNVAGDIPGVHVENLVPAHTGCLHDVQLSADELISLGRSDVLVINGAGAEAFLDRIISHHQGLDIIDTSAGLSLIEPHHEHEHNHDDHDGHDHEHEETEYNEHVWMSPALYMKQVENLRDGLIAADPVHADNYRAGAQRYLEKIRAVLENMNLIEPQKCITFHGSLAYFAQDLGFDTLCELSVGEESGVSAAELATASELAATGNVLLMYDSQYPVLYESIGGAKPRTVIIDTASVSNGAEDRDTWINAMKNNIQKLSKKEW